MDRHRYNAPWDKHMRQGGAWPGLDLRGHTLREIRAKIRGEERDDDASEADGEEQGMR